MPAYTVTHRPLATPETVRTTFVDAPNTDGAARACTTLFGPTTIVAVHDGHVPPAAEPPPASDPLASAHPPQLPPRRRTARAGTGG